MATTDQAPFQITTTNRGYDELFAALLAAVPAGEFYDHTRPIVVWRVQPIMFQLITDNPDVPVKITTLRLGDYAQGVNAGNLVPEVQYMPATPTTTFSITLGRGLNRLIATEQVPGGRTISFEVIATTNATLFEGMGREISKSTLRVQDQSNALYSKYSTRMLDQVIDFQDLLPAVQSLKILSTKLLVRANIHFPAEDLGVRNNIEAFAINTPIFIPQREPTSMLQVERSRIQLVQENSAGQEAHVWFPNLSVTRWLAFTKLADSLRNNYQIESIKDDEIRIIYKGAEQIHRFDFDSAGSNFLTNLTLTNCFESIEVFAKIQTVSSYWLCVWSYPLDSFVTIDHPIGTSRAFLDSGVPFDSGLPFDSDPVDPFTDGWINWSLTGRFEFDAPDTTQAMYPFDSSVIPAIDYPGYKCVYTRGPYSQMFNSQRTDIDVDGTVGYNPTFSFLDDYTPGAIDRLAMDFPIPFVQLVAGTPVAVVVKYADALDMTNPTGAGSITIQESNGGTSTPATVVANGYVQMNLTPTIAGPSIYWDLTDGTFNGTTPPQSVLPGPFAAFEVSAIGTQSVGVPFLVTLQAQDAFGNDVTDVGPNNKVVIQAMPPGFVGNEANPSYVFLNNGMAFFSLQMDGPGTGQVEFKLGAVTQLSTSFTVIP